MLEEYRKFLNNNIIEKLQYIFFIIMIYLLCTRDSQKYDEKVLMILGILGLVDILKNKEYYSLNKKIIFFILAWFIFINISLYKAYILFPTNEYVGAYKVLISAIVTFLVISQIKIDKLLDRKKILDLINILSIYGIYKGLVYSLEKGFFVRGNIWGGPNTYAILLGNFAIISFASFLYSEKKIKKLLYLVLNMCQLFFIISIGQSRTTFCSLMVIYFIGFFFFYFKKKNPKVLIKNTLIMIGIMVIFILIIDKYNLRVSRVSIEALVNNARVGIWKRCLNDGFNIFTGKGLGYYLVGEHRFKDAVGVTIGTLHNDSLELLITQGIFSLISYWGLLLASLLLNIKEYLKFKNEYTLITIMFLIFLILLGMLETAIYVKRLMQFIFLFLAFSIEKEKSVFRDSDL